MTKPTPFEDNPVNITAELSPAEAAQLLSRLDAGARAAWRSTHQVPWLSPAYEASFQAANEVDSVVHDLLVETLASRVRQPGETVEDFARRAEYQARLAHAHRNGAEAATRPVTQLAGAGTTAAAASRTAGELARGLLADADNQQRALAGERDQGDHTAITGGRDLRGREPEQDGRRMVPGTPHPDPFLAERGWHVGSHGLYTRRDEPEQAPPEPQREAG